MPLFRRIRSEGAEVPAGHTGVPEVIDGQNRAEVSGESRRSFTEVVSGLEPKIESLGTIWQAARQAIDVALHAEDVRQEYGQMMRPRLAAEPNIPEAAIRRELEKRVKRELPISVGIAVVTARYEARDSIKGGLQELDDHPLLHMHQNTVKSEDQPLFGFEQRLCRKLIPIYTRAESLEKEVIDTVARYVGSSLEAANEFTDWLISLDAAERQRLQPLLAAMATDLLDPGSRQLLANTFHRFREDPEILAEEYIESELDSQHREGHLLEMATYAAAVIESRTGERHDPKTLLLETVGSWPPGIRTGHQAFVREYLDEVCKVITEQVGPYQSKLQRIPTEQDVESLLRRRKPEQARAVGAKTLKAARVTASSNVAPDFISTAVQEVKVREKPPARLGIAVSNPGRNGLEVVIGDDAEAWEQVSRMIREYADKHPHDKTLAANLEKMVRSILRDPYGRGTINIDDGKTMLVGGKERVKPRRLQPAKRPGLSVGTLAKATRITYYPVKVNGTLGVVLEGIRNHDEYMTWIG